MVRAVPKIVIDFGDGKKILRTMRGNAVMYLLNPDGKVIDAFPGVYAAHAFLPDIRTSIENLAHGNAASVIAYHKAHGRMVRSSLTTLGKTVVESPTLDMIGARPFADLNPPSSQAHPSRHCFSKPQCKSPTSASAPSASTRWCSP